MKFQQQHNPIIQPHDTNNVKSVPPSSSSSSSSSFWCKLIRFICCCGCYCCCKHGRCNLRRTFIFVLILCVDDICSKLFELNLEQQVSIQLLGKEDIWSLPSINTTKKEQPLNGFAACLLVMDDNHYLIEWLAYHYTFLPLRRLIVAVDPKSKTSPRSILDRYSNLGLIDITIWDDDNYFPKVKRLIRNPTNVHRQRQQHFYLQCMKTIKEEYTITLNTNRSLTTTTTTTTTTIEKGNKQRNQNEQQQQQQPPIWVALIDTDEFIVVNNHNKTTQLRIPAFKKNRTTTTTTNTTMKRNFIRMYDMENSTRQRRKSMNSTLSNIISNSRNRTFIIHHHHRIYNNESSSTPVLEDIQPTVYEMLLSSKNSFVQSNQPCIPMSRVNIAVMESLDGWDDIQQWIPTTTNNNNITQFHHRFQTQQQQQVTTNSNNINNTVSSIWNGTNFKTLRYKYLIPKGINGKAMVDLSQVGNNNNINENTMMMMMNDYDVDDDNGDIVLNDNTNQYKIDFHIDNVNVHRPFKNYCTQDNIWITTQDSIFGVYQYGGTYEQYIFRSNDARNNDTRSPSEKWMTLKYPLENDTDVISTQHIEFQSWLSNFLELLGNNVSLAEELLYGVGDVNPQ